MKTLGDVALVFPIAGFRAGDRIASRCPTRCRFPPALRIVDIIMDSIWMPDAP